MARWEAPSTGPGSQWIGVLVPRSWGHAWSPLPMPDSPPLGRAIGAAVPSRHALAETGSGLSGVQSQGTGVW